MSLDVFNVFNGSREAWVTQLCTTRAAFTPRGRPETHALRNRQALNQHGGKSNGGETRGARNASLCVILPHGRKWRDSVENGHAAAPGAVTPVAYDYHDHFNYITTLAADFCLLSSAKKARRRRRAMK